MAILLRSVQSMALVRAACAVATFLAALCPLAAQSATTTTVIDVPTPTSSVRIARYSPAAPVANLIVMPGADGILGLQPDGAVTTGQTVNTAIRNRDALVAAGFSVILVDVPVAMSSGLPRDYRVTPAHVAEVRAVVNAVRSGANLPTWILGTSLGGISAAAFAVAEPNSTPFGLILSSPPYDEILGMNLEALRRPVLLLTDTEDICTFPNASAPIVMARLLGAPAKRHVELSGGGGPLGCDATGPHGFGGLDVSWVSEVTGWIRGNANLVAAPSYQGLWLRTPFEQESGWGINFTQQGTNLFATWFTYDTDGSGMWLVMSDGHQTASGSFAGTLNRTTGPGFDAPTFTPITPANYTAVGTLAVTFTDANSGSMTYTVNGVTQAKPIGRYVFVAGTNCTVGGNAGSSPNYTDLWWRKDGTESGWGLNIVHQGNILFATWFTYQSGGTASSPAKGMWLVMSNLGQTGNGVYSGAIQRTTGPNAFSNAVPFDPTKVTRTDVGNATLAFTDADNATFTYTVDGFTQSKPIQRLSFSAPGTICR